MPKTSRDAFGFEVVAKARPKHITLSALGPRRSTVPYPCYHHSPLACSLVDESLAPRSFLPLPQGVTLAAPQPPAPPPAVVVPPLPKQRASSVGTFTRPAPSAAASSSQPLSLTGPAPPPSRKPSLSPRRGFSGPHKPPLSLEEQQALLRAAQAVATPDRGAASRQKARRRAEIYALNTLLEMHEAELASARV